MPGADRVDDVVVALARGPTIALGRMRLSPAPAEPASASPSAEHMTYVELHCHSSYSFLDGASLPEELAARAAELGYPALALTDHDGVYGSLEFAHAAKDLGVRPITGAEVTLDGGSHVTLLVESSRGLREPVPHPHRGACRHPAGGPGGS